jgi:hypothetical protein
MTMFRCVCVVLYPFFGVGWPSSSIGKDVLENFQD